jgi:hypothetical protein
MDVGGGEASKGEYLAALADGSTLSRHNVQLVEARVEEADGIGHA